MSGASSPVASAVHSVRVARIAAARGIRFRRTHRDQNDAMRDVNLTYRKAFPRRALLEELALLIRDTVPNTLTPLPRLSP